MMFKSQNIPLDIAEKEIHNFLVIQSEVSEQIKNLPEQSQDYFKGKILSYVFEKEKVLELLNVNGDVNGLRVYYGFNSKKLPTLLLVACNIVHDDAGIVQHARNIIFDADNFAAVEWPTGRGTNLAGNFSLADDNF